MATAARIKFWAFMMLVFGHKMSYLKSRQMAIRIEKQNVVLVSHQKIRRG